MPTKTLLVALFSSFIIIVNAERHRTLQSSPRQGRFLSSPLDMLSEQLASSSSILFRLIGEAGNSRSRKTGNRRIDESVDAHINEAISEDKISSEQSEPSSVSNLIRKPTSAQIDLVEEPLSTSLKEKQEKTDSKDLPLEHRTSEEALTDPDNGFESIKEDDKEEDVQRPDCGGSQDCLPVTTFPTPQTNVPVDGEAPNPKRRFQPFIRKYGYKRLKNSTENADNTLKTLYRQNVPSRRPFLSTEKSRKPTEKPLLAPSKPSFTEGEIAAKDLTNMSLDEMQDVIHQRANILQDASTSTTVTSSTESYSHPTSYEAVPKDQPSVDLKSEQSFAAEPKDFDLFFATSTFSTSAAFTTTTTLVTSAGTTTSEPSTQSIAEGINFDIQSSPLTDPIAKDIGKDQSDIAVAVGGIPVPQQNTGAKFDQYFGKTVGQDDSPAFAMSVRGVSDQYKSKSLDIPKISDDVVSLNLADMFHLTTFGLKEGALPANHPESNGLENESKDIQYPDYEESDYNGVGAQSVTENTEPTRKYSFQYFSTRSTSPSFETTSSEPLHNELDKDSKSSEAIGEFDDSKVTSTGELFQEDAAESRGAEGNNLPNLNSNNNQPPAKTHQENTHFVKYANDSNNQPKELEETKIQEQQVHVQQEAEINYNNLPEAASLAPPVTNNIDDLSIALSNETKNENSKKSETAEVLKIGSKDTGNFVAFSIGSSEQSGLAGGDDVLSIDDASPESKEDTTEEKELPSEAPLGQRPYDNPYINYYHPSHRYPDTEPPVDTTTAKETPSPPTPFTVRMRTTPSTAAPASSTTVLLTTTPFTARPASIDRVKFMPYQSGFPRPPPAQQPPSRGNFPHNRPPRRPSHYVPPPRPAAEPREQSPEKKADVLPPYDKPFTVRPTKKPFTVRAKTTLVPHNYVEFSSSKPNQPASNSIFDPSVFSTHDVQLKEPFDSSSGQFHTNPASPTPSKPKLANHRPNPRPQQQQQNQHNEGPKVIHTSGSEPAFGRFPVFRPDFKSESGYVTGGPPEAVTKSSLDSKDPAQTNATYLHNPFGSDFIRLEVDVDKYHHNKSSVGIHHIPLMVNHNIDTFDQPGQPPSRYISRPLRKVSGQQQQPANAQSKPEDEKALLDQMKNVMDKLPKAIQNLPGMVQKMMSSHSSWIDKTFVGRELQDES